MLKNGYIFDLDGTLVDSYPEIEGAFKSALNEIGEPQPDRDRLSPLMGQSMSRVLKTLFPHWSSTQTEAFRDLFFDTYDKVCQLSKPYDGADAVVKYLGDDCVIVTNKPRQWAERLLNELGWGDIKLISPAPALPPKPSPAMMRNAASRLCGSNGARKVIAVGDAEVDRISACRAQLPYYQVAWSSHKGRCDGVVANWHEFLLQVRSDGGVGDVYLGS